jgi:Cdc6-like AAA superfamily ATPase
MPVRINANAEPLSFAARTDTPPHPLNQAGTPPTPILAQSQAGDLLRHEMTRYCDGLVRGRSFLISGHRGSGKTTLVDQVVRELQVASLKRELRFKPLPIYLQGPLIFPTPKPPKVFVRPDVKVAVNVGADAATLAAALRASALVEATIPPDKDDDDEDNPRIETKVLRQVAQGLHQAVAKEYVERFHLHARKQLDEGASDADELAELAARFQIELTEAPPAYRLQEYWECAGLTKEGVLFGANNGRGAQQGLREMVVLSGVSHVYQRISGRIEEADRRRNGQASTSETTTGVDSKLIELFKPLTSVVAGGAVGAAGALGGSPVWAVVLGVLTALGASLLFKVTSTQTRQRERTVDNTFIPDLGIKTLHRVMPELFERLHAAGLAPVFIVDELDKVDDLYNRLQVLLDSLKKLFAERAFTCLVTDRGFYEELHWREELQRRAASPPQPPAPPPATAHGPAAPAADASQDPGEPA